MPQATTRSSALQPVRSSRSGRGQRREPRSPPATAARTRAVPRPDPTAHSRPRDAERRPSSPVQAVEMRRRSTIDNRARDSRSRATSPAPAATSPRYRRTWGDHRSRKPMHDAPRPQTMPWRFASADSSATLGESSVRPRASSSLPQDGVRQMRLEADGPLRRRKTRSCRDPTCRCRHRPCAAAGGNGSAKAVSATRQQRRDAQVAAVDARRRGAPPSSEPGARPAAGTSSGSETAVPGPGNRASVLNGNGSAPNADTDTPASPAVSWFAIDVAGVGDGRVAHQRADVVAGSVAELVAPLRAVRRGGRCRSEYRCSSAVRLASSTDGAQRTCDSRAAHPDLDERGDGERRRLPRVNHTRRPGQPHARSVTARSAHRARRARSA